MVAKTKPLSQPVGSIVASMLTEAQFQGINGSDWVLADGRSVAGTIYETATGSSTVPDLRGMALRGKNNGRSDGNQDPGGERALGNFQNDAMQGHFHGITTYSTNLGGGSLPGTAQNTPQSTSTGAAITDGVNGTPRTASETRVKNIAVNYFIKVS